MAKITINELLDSTPLGGVITAYAPIDEVTRCASERNSALRGEWFDVTCAIDKAGRVIAVIARRELWNIADAGKSEDVAQASTRVASIGTRSLTAQVFL